MRSKLLIFFLLYSVGTMAQQCYTNDRIVDWFQQYSNGYGSDTWNTEMYQDWDQAITNQMWQYRNNGYSDAALDHFYNIFTQDGVSERYQWLYDNRNDISSQDIDEFWDSLRGKYCEVPNKSGYFIILTFCIGYGIYIRKKL